MFDQTKRRCSYFGRVRSFQRVHPAVNEDEVGDEKRGVLFPDKCALFHEFTRPVNEDKI